jgi:hypothetical protein
MSNRIQMLAASAILGACTASGGETTIFPLREATASDPALSYTSVSSRRFKEDVSYLSAKQLDDVTEDLLKIRLATFRYKQSGGRHLGYILEDSPDIAASEMEHLRVDLYGYTSMAVAALQVQARQIQQLEHEVDLLTLEVERLRPPGHMGPLSALEPAEPGTR